MTLVLLGMALAAPAPTPTPTIYGGLSAGYQGGDVIAGGVGGELGLRLPLSERLSLHADLAPRLFLLPALEVNLGAVYSLSLGAWEPGLGLELASLWGGRLRRFTESDLTLARGPSLAARGMLRPLCFGLDPWTICGPALALGAGLDGGLGLGVDVMQIGWRLPTPR